MSAPAPVIVHRKRRNVELALLIPALAIGIGAYVITNLNLYGAPPDNLPVAAAIWVGLALVTHGAIRWRLPYADPVILPCVFVLNGLGLAMIHRIDQIPDPIKTDAATQLMWTGLGVALFLGVVIFLRDHRPLQGFTYLLAAFGLLLLLLPLVPGLGLEAYDAKIWISVFGFSFQPAEAAKIILAIAFASYLVEKRDVLALAGLRVAGLDLPRPRDLGPIGLIWAASMAVLVFQRDLGTALLFFGLFVMMLYVATERPGWVVLGALMFGVGGALGYKFFWHVQVRFNAWLDPFSNFDQNLQVINAQFGFAWGGLLGTGLGLGRPGLTALAKSDFIAAAIGEELGVTGLMAVIMVYGLIIARGLRTALVCRDPFGKLLAAGLAFGLALQVFSIIGGVTRLLPLTGLTTPFMSQGGSSLIANWVIVAMLLLISHHARKPVSRITEVSRDAEPTQVIRRASA